ncbi:hypothetical protein L209DRAFT_216676 [Thermothelomyces heterothallicus CBS 203.75]
MLFSSSSCLLLLLPASHACAPCPMCVSYALCGTGYNGLNCQMEARLGGSFGLSGEGRDLGEGVGKEGRLDWAVFLFPLSISVYVSLGGYLYRFFFFFSPSVPFLVSLSHISSLGNRRRK